MDTEAIRELVRKEGIWLLIVIISAILSLLVNLAGLLFGITNVLPHLLYIPLIIAAYRFPKKGVGFAFCISLLYLVMLGAFAGNDPATLIAGVSRAVVMIAVAWIIARLSFSVVEQKERYRALFDNAEAGAAQVRVSPAGVVIEEANYRLGTMLKMTAEELKGRPVASFWDDAEARKDFASRVRHDGACYAYESKWKRGDGSPIDILISAGRIAEGTSIITVIDITDQKNMESALRNANATLNLLSRLMRTDLQGKVRDAESIISEGTSKPAGDPGTAGILSRLGNILHALRRRLELAASFQDLGKEAPAWQPVQRTVEGVVARSGSNGISVRAWTERLEIYADNHLDEIFFNLIDNAIRYGGTTTEVVITYHRVDNGIEIIIEDDGRGIPGDAKESIFGYGSMSHGGFGLFVNRQILGVTGITLTENGTYGSGARFVLHVPQEGYRIL